MRTEYADRNIRLRRFSPEDAVALYEAANESLAEIRPWMRWFEGTFSLADSREWIARGERRWTQQEAFNFAIVTADTGRLLGSCWISHIFFKHKYGNIGYWVRSSCAGKGIAVVATALLARFGFAELQLHRLEIMVAVGNRRSERVAEKLGACREGVLRERLHLQGAACDATMFSLLARDLENLKSPRP